MLIVNLEDLSKLFAILQVKNTAEKKYFQNEEFFAEFSSCTQGDFSACAYQEEFWEPISLA
jgi:hypothetical protein